MKKSLIALAAFAATSAFAQSSVSIGGTLDIAAIQNATITTKAGSGATAEDTLNNTRVAGPNTWATSVLTISGTEDLGGGLKASFLLMSGAGTNPNATDNATDTGVGNRERTLALSSASLGTVRFGRFVPAAAAGFHAFSGAGSATLAGSAYGLSQGHSATAAGLFGGNALHANAVSFERQNNVVQYTSPTFGGGFSANVAFAKNSLDSNATTAAGKLDSKQTSLHVAYANGPLSIGAGMNTRKAETEAVAATTQNLGVDPIVVGVAAVTNKSTDSKLNWIGASYNLGVASLFGTHATRVDNAITAAGASTVTNNTKLTAVGVAAPVGAFTLRASTYFGKDTRTVATDDNMTLTGSQISAVYALSKRTSLIAATGTNQYQRDTASTAATRKVTASTLSMVHTF